MSKKRKKVTAPSTVLQQDAVEDFPITQRVVVRVTPDGERWKLTQEPPSYLICRPRTQRKAKKIGRLICLELKDEGRPSQLVIHEEDGTISYENTYLADPPDRPG